MFKDLKQAKPTETLIGQGSEMEGVLKCKAGVRIEGKFQGEIESTGEVIVGGTGEAHSNIKGASVLIAGKVFGDIVTDGKLVLTATGHIVGNVEARSFVIIEGGVLSGESRMEKIAEAPAAVPQKRKKTKAEARRA
ncbi:polymer-forming cytoskeletal protein [Paenibacillus sp. CAA11]|nr:polymer-forming cytoskeletal protein [Paenibacillus sp. CAA11]